MATRVIYLCDWCSVESDKPGFVGDCWKQIESGADLSGLEWLCEKCFAHYKAAVLQARGEHRGAARADAIVSSARGALADAARERVKGTGR